MNEFEYFEKSKNQIITVDTLNKKNDCFIRYLFSDTGNENIVLDFINGVMIDLNFKTFNKLEILNPFNLSKYLDGKESIVDAKCITDDNEIVIIEIQLQGNQSFIGRSLYYWANSYSSLLNKSDNYTKLAPMISINILDFMIFDNYNINTIIHLAGYGGVRPSIDNPRLYIDNNIIATLNILECMKKYEVKKIIFASSSSVYGNSKENIFT